MLGAFFACTNFLTPVSYADSPLIKGSDTALDLYCGIGTIGICASDKIKRLIGIEQNAAAVRDANINAELNNIQNAEFFCGDSGEIMQKIENSGVKIDVVLKSLH